MDCKSTQGGLLEFAIFKKNDCDAGYLVIPLAILTGIAYSLERAMTGAVGDRYELTKVTLLVLIGGSIGGLISVYLGGTSLFWVGNMLGGQGKKDAVRAAVAWSSIPWILLIFFEFILIALMGTEAFSSYTPRFDARFTSNPVILAWSAFYY